MPLSDERLFAGRSLESASTKEEIMRNALPKPTPATRSHRPRAITVFAAAFVAGAAAAVGVNRTLDVRLAQAKPRVESEAIFVALRSLPQGAPVTVWDVALRDWPKAMLPTTALRARDSFSGHVLKHPLREGQPLLSIQLSPAEQATQPPAEQTTFPPPAAYTQSAPPAVPVVDADIWAAVEPIKAAAIPAAPAAAATQPVVPDTVPAPAAAQLTAVVPEQEAVPKSDTVVQAEPAIATPAGSIPAPADQPPIDGSSSAAMTDSSPTAPITENDPSVAITDSAVAGLPPADVASVAVEPKPDTTPVPSQTIAPLPIAPAPVTASIPAVAPAPPAPAPASTETARPQASHQRFLVVPESIAVQADASFTARPGVGQSEVKALPPTVPTPPTRATAEVVRPLPSTTTAERRPQARPQGNSPQSRQPQRQGRQTPPATTGAAAGSTSQPHVGQPLFPNVTAGIEAIEGRLRRDPSGQGETPTAAQARPVTAR